ncbi:DUF2075 domain-containing protein [Actinomadura kijaniata]|uniref:AAA+ ATPase domain-containing protein n=1 Tax=Actinomadura namibiensis TaxID=182080 RepID=A0A7W3LTA9_ACTNM|nr:DNA/RNA helicase domain-containing protein [Actinomadura namibiensis]MBA8953918.1 hypothetical protein [Actinomadura namibiensis]
MIATDPTAPQALTPPESQVPCVWSGRVAELAECLQQPTFLQKCIERYQQVGFGVVDDGEYGSWERSWPVLVEVLLRAGLDQMQVYLEFGAAGGAQRIDALVLATASDGAPALVVIELKQWRGAQVLSPHLVRRSDGEEVMHPAAQVSSYLAFLRHWFEAGTTAVQIRGLAFLHNARTADVQPLRDSRNEHCLEVPILSKDDLDVDTPPTRLAELLLMADLQPPHDERIQKFERARWVPSRRLLDSVGAMLEGDPSFVLIGDQQHALVKIFNVIDTALQEGSSAVVAVTGGPGSGKTVIATRLLARSMRDSRLDVRYASPSGTLIAQLRRSTRQQGADNLFTYPDQAVGRKTAGARMVVLDEAQRLTRIDRGPSVLQKLVQAVSIVVLFLDERQIIRPNEGITLSEVEQAAAEHGARMHVLSLAGTFRTGGSRAYAAWVDNLLYGTPTPWTGADFDLALATDPPQLQEWINHYAAAGARARIAAGFCWPWKRDQRKLLPEVNIPWLDQHGAEQTWTAPWNAVKAITGDTTAPASKYWATDPGGHQQVGCIYTAQGLEYDYGGVFFGPDLVRRGGTWQAHPQHSHDPSMRNLTSQQYLPLALNIYRVLLTRSTRAMRVYSTDPETQRFLKAHLALAKKQGSSI